MKQTLSAKLRKRLKKARSSFQSNHPHAHDFFNREKINLLSIRAHARRMVASSIVAGTLVLGSPNIAELTRPETVKYENLSDFERESLFARELRRYIPTNSHKLSSAQEESISSLIADYWNINAYPVLEHKRLNHTYGSMGAEQHLPRYPGDSIYEHDDLQHGGITPARGAWGYFAQSKAALTKMDIQREKYYIAVQTLYLPEWNSNWVELKQWYKYRKMIVVNPENGRTVVVVVADAGPAKWTGKVFGGSPEVMNHLDLYKGPMKGDVVLFFVDDPDDKIPLGPVT